MTDTIRVRGRVTRDDMKDMLAEVRANIERLKGCSRHRFESPGVRLGEKVTCLNCGGMMGLTDVGSYIAGYQAAGGSADDVWPGYGASR